MSEHMKKAEPVLIPKYQRCHCGRFMGLILGDGPCREWEVRWCAGCGTVHIHYDDPNEEDSRYVPDPKLIGKT